MTQNQNRMPKGLMTKRDWGMMNWINLWGLFIVSVICLESGNNFGFFVFITATIIVFLTNKKSWGLI